MSSYHYSSQWESPPTFHSRYITPPSIIDSYQKLKQLQLLQQLNAQNQFLSQNMRNLITENSVLKSRLSQKEEIRQKVKDTPSHPRRYEWKNNQKNQQKSQNKSKSKLIKNQSRSKDQIHHEYNLQRQNSPGYSELRGPTIIEGLSQSQFQEKDQSPHSKNDENKGENQKLKDNEKLSRSSDNRKRQQNGLKNQNYIKLVQKKAEEKKNDNPQKELQTTKGKKRISKKDNSPYLQVKSTSGTSSHFYYLDSSKKNTNNIYLGHHLK